MRHRIVCIKPGVYRIVEDWPHLPFFGGGLVVASRSSDSVSFRSIAMVSRKRPPGPAGPGELRV